MGEEVTDVKVPSPTFVIGDRRTGMNFDTRPIYGPADEKGGRQEVGTINRYHTVLLTSMLEYADAHMAKEDA